MKDKPESTRSKKLFKFLDRGDVPSIVLDTAPPIQDIISRVAAKGYPVDAISKENAAVAYESRYACRDVERAAEVLVYFLDASDNKISPITHACPASPSHKAYYRLLGADNRNAVTCYLDTLLFSMFARINDFEPMLKKVSPDNADIDSLTVFIRLYVNMLRDGKHITQDITKLLINALIKAGWESTGAIAQQDCCELFNFVTDILSMPMLTLKLEIAHEGLDSKEDDHKLVNERLLLVTIPGDSHDEPILLEQCLESYFANSVQVFRQLERRRTLDSTQSAPKIRGRKRQLSICVSSREITEEEQQQPAAATTPTQSHTPTQQNSPQSPQDLLPTYSSLYQNPVQPPPEKHSLSSLPPNTLWTPNKEFSLPAWMFLQLVPFYTNPECNKTPANPLGIAPATDSFAGARPVVAICLKRSNWTTSNNHAVLNNRKVIVPQVIHFPNFVADNNEDDVQQSEHTNTNAADKFVLVLESAIFHRGASTNAGHFVAIARENNSIPYDPDLKKNTPTGPGSRWIFFDDLKPLGEKVTVADFETVFRRENPYLLFYRLVTVADYTREQEAGADTPDGFMPVDQQQLEQLLQPLQAPEPPIDRTHTIDTFNPPGSGVGIASEPTSPRTSIEIERPTSRQMTPFDLLDNGDTSEITVNQVDSDSDSSISGIMGSSQIIDGSTGVTNAQMVQPVNAAAHVSPPAPVAPTAHATPPAPPPHHPHPSITIHAPVAVHAPQLSDSMARVAISEPPAEALDKKKKGMKRNKSLYKSLTSLRKSRSRPPSPSAPEGAVAAPPTPSKGFRKSMEATFGGYHSKSSSPQLAPATEGLGVPGLGSQHSVASARSVSPVAPMPTYKARTQSIPTSPKTWTGGVDASGVPTLRENHNHVNRHHRESSAVFSSVAPSSLLLPSSASPSTTQAAAAAAAAASTLSHKPLPSLPTRADEGKMASRLRGKNKGVTSIPPSSTPSSGTVSAVSLATGSPTPPNQVMFNTVEVPSTSSTASSSYTSLPPGGNVHLRSGHFHGHLHSSSPAAAASSHHGVPLGGGAMGFALDEEEQRHAEYRKEKCVIM